MKTTARKKAGEKIKQKSYQELKAENPEQRYVKFETYEALKSVNVSLSQANEELQAGIEMVEAKYRQEIRELYDKKRELEVRIEGMIAEVKGARATAEILERDITTMGAAINTLTKSNENLVYQLDDVKQSREQTEKEWHIDRAERDTLSRLLKIIKATVNGMTLDGEDRVSPMGEGLNG